MTKKIFPRYNVTLCVKDSLSTPIVLEQEHHTFTSFVRSSCIPLVIVPLLPKRKRCASLVSRWGDLKLPFGLKYGCTTSALFMDSVFGLFGMDKLVKEEPMVGRGPEIRCFEF